MPWSPPHRERPERDERIEAYDEHYAPAEHSTAEHAHSEDCGHESVQHGDHVDYVHDGHKHAVHANQYDEH